MIEINVLNADQTQPNEPGDYSYLITINSLLADYCLRR